MFDEWVRRTGFWGLDSLRGKKIRQHYNDIQYMLENHNHPDVFAKREGYLRNILKYAVEHVPYYSKIDLDAPLTSFPVVNKNIIRDNFSSFRSSQYQEDHLVKMHTSGSTGTPFAVLHDKNKRNRAYAEMIYLWQRAGYRVGMRYLFLKMRTSLSRITAWSRNVIWYSVLNQSEENLENIRRILKSDQKIQMILCYPSILDILAGYLLTHGDTPEMFNVSTIIGFGESFPAKTHQKLKEVFGCQNVSLYSNQENGMLAIECVENKEFHVNNASYHIELLKNDSDDPVNGSEPGRIVVTDLFNYAMPLIRYDTGDIGVWKKDVECGWESLALASIDGQKTDFIYDTRGNQKSPHIISVLLEPFDQLLQYQFIQEDAKRYVLKLNGAEGHYENAAFLTLLKDLLGSDAEITIEHVREVPALSSGKRKEVICNYKKPHKSFNEANHA